MAGWQRWLQTLRGVGDSSLGALGAEPEKMSLQLMEQGACIDCSACSYPSYVLVLMACVLSEHLPRSLQECFPPAVLLSPVQDGVREGAL